METPDNDYEAIPTLVNTQFDSTTSESISRKSTPTGKTEYACKLCHLVFPNSTQYGRHRIIHADVTFKCSTCDKEFISKKNLKDHERRNHKKLKAKIEKILDCQICGKVFTKQSRYDAVDSTIRIFELKLDERNSVKY